MIRIFERSCIQNFILDSVAADSTGGGPLDFFVATGQNMHTGILRGVSVACGSTDFDISIRTKSNAAEDTVDEIYRVTGIDKYRSDDNLYQGWVNGDSPLKSKLYVTLINADSVNATGDITVKILIEINKRFSRNN